MRIPRRCRWFGHDWRSTITGEPIDIVFGGDHYVRCARCGWWQTCR